MFVKKHPGKKWVVNEYLKKGNPLVIDTSSLENYPFNGNRELYLEYGKVTTSAKFSKGTRNCFIEMMSCFKEISELTLSQVRLTNIDDLARFPQNLSILHVVDSEIAFLYQWLEILKPHLVSLVLDCNLKEHSSKDGFNLESVFGKLKRLTVRDLTEECFKFICPELEYLYCGLLPTVWSLSEMRCDDLTTLKNLQNLSVSSRNPAMVVNSFFSDP